MARKVLLAVILASLALAAQAADVIRHSFSKRPGHFIVVFKEHVGIERAYEHLAAVESQKISMSAEYMDAGETWEPPKFFEIPEEDGTPMVGYTTFLTPEHLEMLRDDPDVEYVEEDQIIQIGPLEGPFSEPTASEFGERDGPSFDERPAEDEPSLYEPFFDDDDDKVIQRKKAAWGLARVSQRKWSSEDRDARLFSYGPEDGKNVTVYVIDTGVYVYHPEFEGRASLGISYVRNRSTGEPEDALDQNGHGTHCASTVAGKTFGVAPNAQIVAVRVLDAGGSGSLSDVIDGVSWATKEHLKRGRSSKSVISMSLGGGRSPTLDRAVNGAAVAGVHVVVAAGNESSDACNGSPGAAKKVITVGATDVADNIAFFSNWGKCVNILAPGHRIEGAWLSNGTNIISGTSMATPHVAGVVASYLSRSEEAIGTKEMMRSLEKLATRDAISGLPEDPEKETKNYLAYSCPGFAMADCGEDGSEPSDRPVRYMPVPGFCDQLSGIQEHVKFVMQGPARYFFGG